MTGRTTKADGSILGRSEELGAITRFVADDRPSVSALVLEGDAGIGKTTLWREAVRLARRRSLVLMSHPSQPEMRLAFAVLHDLLDEHVEDVAPRLSGSQRAALDTALLRSDPSASHPDARAVGLAVRSALVALAADRRLTIAIDDIQWVDEPTARTLAFALRRLTDSRISILATRRVDGVGEDRIGLDRLPGGIERLVVGPVSISMLRPLLRDQLGRDFRPSLVAKIHEASGGNPLFALEIGRALGPYEPELAPGTPLPVPSSLQQLLEERLTSLTEVARSALLIAAASPRPTVALLRAAGADTSGLEEAEEAGVVQIRLGTLDFMHPLLASTVYARASSLARRNAHERLARCVEDAEERARHLALSVHGPDEAVARALEDAAMHAQLRGAPSTAAELNDLAVAITPQEERDRRSIRWFRMLGSLFAAGDVAAVRAAIDRRADELEAGPERAHALYLAAAWRTNDVNRNRELLRQALDESGDDAFLQVYVLGDLAWTELWGGDPRGAIACADAADERSSRLAGRRTLGNPDADPLRTAVSARALASFVLGNDATGPLLRAAEREGALDFSDVDSPQTYLGVRALWRGELDAARQTLEGELARYLAQGRETASWDVRAWLAETELRAGRWVASLEHAREAENILADADWEEPLAQVLATKAAVEAALGDETAARLDGRRALDLALRMGSRWDEVKARSALGFLDLSLGDHRATHAWLEPAVQITERMDVREPGAFPFVPDEVEALVGLGELDRASELIERLDEQGRSLGRPLAIATAARCRALLRAARGDADGALAAVAEAVRSHAEAAHPFEVGRTQLVRGEILRRFKQRKQARASLDAAREVFESLGAALWLRRTQAAAARLGRVVGAGALTPTERSVAELLADGRTNREIADTLFLSVKTVEANVSRILGKLGAASRREVARLLAERENAATQE
jgi:DNA-binding NarL/FixJ family response regulator